MTETKSETRRLLRVPEAARAMGLSERKVWSLIATRELPACRIGRAVRIDLADLDRLIEGAKAGAVR